MTATKRKKYPATANSTDAGRVAPAGAFGKPINSHPSAPKINPAAIPIAGLRATMRATASPYRNRTGLVSAVMRSMISRVDGRSGERRPSGETTPSNQEALASV